MGFFNKNWGLILFLVCCLGMFIYQTIGILRAHEELEVSISKCENHLSVLDTVRKSGQRLDEENLAKATRVAEAAKVQYSRFLGQLSSKQLLPGVDLMIDLDDDAAVADAEPKSEPEVDEEGNPLPAKPKVDPYSEHANRKLYDAWTKGSMIDARNELKNALISLNRLYFKNDEDEDGPEAGQMTGGMVTPASKSQKAEADKKAGERKEKAEKAAAEEKEKALEEGKTMYDVEKEKRRKIVKGLNVPEYFMFEDLVTNRDHGLRDKKERRNAFRQYFLLKTLCDYLQKSEITELEMIDFPCGMEILDGDRYTTTPVTMTVTGKPECIEGLLNLLNAGENYLFYLRDITSLTAALQINHDPLLVFNQGATTSGAAELESFLASALSGATNANGSNAGGGAEMGGGRRARRNRSEMQDMPRGGRMNMAPAEPGMGTGPDGRPMMEEPPKTRKAYRVFIRDDAQSGTGGGMRGAGMGDQPGGAPQTGTSAELGTSVRVTLNFEYVEFKKEN